MPERLSFAYVLIVRQGCEDKLAILQESFAHRASIRVIVDRRVGDRRGRPGSVPNERRRSDRRHAPPPSWEVADYVLVAERQP